jgi:AcrR family transcriptional regulator
LKSEPAWALQTDGGRVIVRTPVEREGRKNDPEKTKDDILTVATEEFSEYGLSGGRVDAIAEKTRTSKRMIYYYFGSKEGLYLAVLEKAYRKIRSLEADLELADMPPVEALRTLIASTFDHDENNPEFVRLVSIENIHHANHMKRSSEIGELNLSIVRTISDILERGRSQGVFRREVDAIDLHMLVSAFCFFRVSNRHTFGTIFHRDLSEPKLYARHKQMIADAVIAYVTHSPESGQ